MEKTYNDMRFDERNGNGGIVNYIFQNGIILYLTGIS